MVFFNLRQSPVFVAAEEEWMCLDKAAKVPRRCLPILLLRLLPQTVQVRGLQNGCP
jgi:hypothetical protein